jgi:multiple sugar transport system permease protein/raffinose/stachyose/melibiose transport system permease protein
MAQVRRVPLVLFVAFYHGGDGRAAAVVTMSLRTTTEIFKAPYGFPSPAHGEKFADAWTKSNYGTYFWNSTIVVVVAVALVTVVGAMAAHCLCARYTFRGNRLVRFLILTGLVCRPSCHPCTVPDPARHRLQVQHPDGAHSRPRGHHIAMTVYILEGFFAQTAGFVRRRADGRLLRLRDLLARDGADRRARDLHYGDTQFHRPVERVSVRSRAVDRRR